MGQVSVLPAVDAERGPSSRSRAELFLISFLLLFLELACIRWFPAHVLFLTFFTNTILLASFLGMSLGCLAARRPQNFLAQTPFLLVVTLVAGLCVERLREALFLTLNLGNQVAPQVVFFGNDYQAHSSISFIPMEVIEGFFFFMLALVLAGPGQELGRAFDRLPNRVEAYTLNILGSLAGIILFAACSWLGLSPFWWFLAIALGVGYFLLVTSSARRSFSGRWGTLVALALVPVLASLTSGSHSGNSKPVSESIWSPYYRIEYTYPPVRHIEVNLIGHQTMVSRHGTEGSPAFAYSLPYLFQRDSGGKPFQDVLVIGAGSGNDVSRALQWGVSHVDAVEIDPVILRLGKRDHPDQPYQDPRVSTYSDDGRNFLRSTDRQYDLIVYALVDSLVLHSSYSDIRLESFLFTREAFEDVRRHLKPGGLFVAYNYFRHGWIVGRVSNELRETFGGEPLVLTLPYREAVARAAEADGFTMCVSGATEGLRRAFADRPEYWLSGERAPSPLSPNGFEQNPAPEERRHWIRFGLAKVVDPEEVGTATDDWPFLYVRRRMIPGLSLRGMATMGGLSLLLLVLFLREGPKGDKRWRLDGRMFFLGAGFMLLETEAVVHMALLFGSTWMVNTVVFVAVLGMILGANLYVLKRRPARLWPYYLGLMVSLAMNAVIPLDFFLGMNRALQAAASSLLVFAPILFAGVIFAVAFGRSRKPDRDFGANVGGAILGGLAEYSSTLLGFQYLTLLAVLFYALSAALGRKHTQPSEWNNAQLLKSS